MTTTQIATSKTSDKGYTKNRTGAFKPGVQVRLLEPVYFGHQWEAGTVGTIVSVSNGGFRGIETFVKVGDEYMGGNLDSFAVAQ